MGRTQGRSVVAAAVVSAGAVAYGCGSSSGTGNAANPEAGSQDAAPREAAASSGSGTADVFVPLGCPVPDGLTSWTPPAYLHAKHDPTACTRQDIIDYSTACMKSNQAPRDCPVYRQNHAGCAACLESASADPTWGPLVFWPNGQTELNTSGCFELLVGPSDPCGPKVQVLDQCAHAACDITCAQAQAFYMGACTTSAYAGPCMTYSTASLCAVPDAGGSPAALCQAIGNGSPDSELLQIAPYFCGGAGGTVSGDGGTPTDSGSGGSTDASSGGSDAPADAPRDAPKG